MKRGGLIRLGGLAAMAGGVLYALEHTLNAGQPAFTLLLIAAMVATVCVALLLPRERYGWLGALTSLISFVGLALVLWANQVINSVRSTDPMAEWGLTALLAGILAATVGLVVLAIVTTNARMLPWWGRVALVAGSPLGLLVLMMLPSMFSESLSEGPWQVVVEALVGVPWVLAGYALLRAGARLSEQPLRVR